MTTGILIAKITSSFQDQLKTSIELENKIIQQEKLLEKNPELFVSQKMAFIPDHLEWGLEEGVDLYQILVPPVASIVSVRRQEPMPFLFSSYCSRGPFETVVLDSIENQSFRFSVMQKSTALNSILVRDGREHVAQRLVYELPFIADKGFLSIKPAFFNNRWHTVLLLNATDRLNRQSILLVFDLTDNVNSLSPLLEYSTEDLSSLTTRAAILRFPEGQYGIMVCGRSESKSYLHFISLDEPTTPISYPLDIDTIQYFVMVDLMQTGYANRIYLGNENQLLALNILQRDRPVVTQFDLESTHILTPPIVVPDSLGEGVQLYFIGFNFEGRGVFRIHDPLTLEKVRPGARFILAGDFLIGYVRFGQYWLIPKDIHQDPSVLELPTDRLVINEKISNEEESRARPETRSGFNRLVTRLVWDPLEKKETLITLNDSCQLNIEKRRPYPTPYGRLTWQKIH